MPFINWVISAIVSLHDQVQDNVAAADAISTAGSKKGAA
jgi:hypothetical protein